MNRLEQIEGRVNQLIAKIASQPIEAIQPATHLYNELQVDSLQFLILLDEIELEFAISIDFNDFDQRFFETPDMIANYVRSRLQP